jgi:hypothetical protein
MDSIGRRQEPILVAGKELEHVRNGEAANRVFGRKLSAPSTFSSGITSLLLVECEKTSAGLLMGR